MYSLVAIAIYPMEFTNLSPKTKTETSPSLKRKWSTDPTVDLQLKQPLPSDWEQCLDLQSGKMYYVNRETSRRSWNMPNDGLELRMMSGDASGSSSSERNQASDSDSNMVALACSNCHLLVMLSTDSPSCPNCKYVHSLKSKTPVGGRSF